MQIEKCNACGKPYGCICLAQYRNGPAEAYICRDCYADGQRCWVLADNSLIVQAEQPTQAVLAMLYWDEGNFVTRDNLDVTYPSTFQPGNPAANQTELATKTVRDFLESSDWDELGLLEIPGPSCIVLRNGEDTPRMVMQMGITVEQIRQIPTNEHARYFRWRFGHVSRLFE